MNNSHRFKEIASVALLSLVHRYPKIDLYLVSSSFWLFFYDTSQELNLNQTFLQIGFAIPEASHEQKCYAQENKSIIVIGNPEEIVKNIELLPKAPLIFVTIPTMSYSFRRRIWRENVIFEKFDFLCIPFVTFKDYIQVPIGSYQDIFFGDEVYMKKSMKTVLSSLEYIFGGFSRVFGVGDFASEISKGFEDGFTKSNKNRNILVMIDRNADLMNVIKVHNSYIGYLDELYELDQDVKLTIESISKILNISTKEAHKLKVFKDEDVLFEKIDDLPLNQALSKISNLNIRTTSIEEMQKEHKEIINEVSQAVKNSFELEVFKKIQEKTPNYEPDIYGRILCLDDSFKYLGFRLLSLLCIYKMEKETESIARLLSAKYSIKHFAKWNQIYEYLQKQDESTIKPPKEEINISNLSRSGLILSKILTRKKSNESFEFNPHYFSKESYIPFDRQRWFIIMIGGMCKTELSEFKKISKICRPNDEFIFMTTKLLSPNIFMKDLLE